MERIEQERIVKICKEFASGFDFPINGSAWLICDPLSAYLETIEGIENYLMQLPEKDGIPQIMILNFPDGSQLIPAGKDLGIECAENWLWIEPKNNHLKP